MKKQLYDTDFVSWTEEQARYLQQHEMEKIDWQNIEEEIIALGRSEKHELENRLEVLLEHLLKRGYINSAYDNRGWEITIKEQRKQIRRLLRDSPSLKNYGEALIPAVWQEALADVQDLYPTLSLPEANPFSESLDQLLTVTFW
ncbi:DUF29 domain-containing protein [Synechocystis sp. FACHB-383]|uniref:DUF29 domain-containing protein n=1 Tax=Synechocystis sp. FACHB-383 TaxID=2692864 RepID=UPI0016827818|nr:DUF29 domain-containing protein [Synechocystis sp. FACHB-383]MBD2654632.1 DUF29 domain-containing protein [Synechocystis sp. FACHB-383]